jgi:hypothetical protein
MLAACCTAVIPSGLDLITASAKAICIRLTLALTVKKVLLLNNPPKPRIPDCD